MNTNINELMTAANHVAGQSDRWLFIATLLVLGVFAVGVMRYFVRQHERLIADHREARDAYQSSLSEMVSEQSSANQKLIVCLDNNTRVLEECRDELRFSRIERTALNHGTHEPHGRGTG